MGKFHELINSGKPVLVDFYADWCGPCKIMAPILKEVASDIDGKARILKVDVDKNPQAAAEYGIQGIPTLILFKNGQIRWRQAGVVPKAQLLTVLQSHI